MIFLLSFLMWCALSDLLTPEGIVVALFVSLIAELISRKIMPGGIRLKAMIRILSAFPRAFYAGSKLAFSKPLFTSRERSVPSDRIGEFAEVVSTTMTPDEIVVFEEGEKLIIHGVEKWR